jgi:regulator of sigma D
MTATAVAFNDKYDESDHQLVLNHLSEDLSSLGEEIAVCMEQEDRLLSVLLN